MRRLAHLQSCFGSDRDGKAVLAGDRVSVTLSDVRVVRCFKNGGLLVEDANGKRRPIAAGSYALIEEPS